MAIQKIQAALENARKALQNAQARFQSGSNALQQKASGNIDLFGGTVTSHVAEIATASRNLCDTLYAACQTQVKILDETCRPLLDEDIPVTAVKDVWKMIGLLNEESCITNNFTASLNGKGLGDVATVQYHPSMESKMIESYWESRYQSWPGREEYEKQLEAAKRKKEEDRKEAAKKTKHIEEEQYKQAQLEWTKKAQDVEQKRERLLRQELDAQQLRSEEQIKQKKEQEIAAQTKRKEQLLAAQEKVKAALAQLRFYQIFLKIRYQKAIKDSILQISAAEQAIAAAERTYNEEQLQLKKAIQQRKTELTQAMRKKYPLPRKPRKPASMLYENPSTYQVIAEFMKTEIINTLEKHGKLTYMELMQKNPNLNDLTYQRIVNYAKKLQQEGEIVITREKNGIVYDDFCDLAY